MYGDSGVAILLADKPLSLSMLQHIHIRCGFIRDEIGEGDIPVVYVDSRD